MGGAGGKGRDEAQDDGFGMRRLSGRYVIAEDTLGGRVSDSRLRRKLRFESVGLNTDALAASTRRLTGTPCVHGFDTLDTWHEKVMTIAIFFNCGVDPVYRRIRSQTLARRCVVVWVAVERLSQSYRAFQLLCMYHPEFQSSCTNRVFCVDLRPSEG